MKKNSAATMKDQYIKMLESGLKPQEIKKFTDEMTKKDPSQVKDVKPTGPVTKTPGAIGSVEEDVAYLKGNEFGSQKLAVDSNCPIKDGKNPDASEDIEYLKKNDFSKTAKEKNPEASEDLEALKKNNFSKNAAYGDKRDFPKIDIYVDGKYNSSTTWAKTCAEAKEMFLKVNKNIDSDSVKCSFAKKASSKNAAGLFPQTKYMVSIYSPEKNEDGTYTQKKINKEITAKTPNEAAKKFVSEVLKQSSDSLVLGNEQPVKNGDSVSRVWSTLIPGYGQKLWVKEVEPMRVGGSLKKAGYGDKRDFPKIDIYVDGKYNSSTTWAKTCAEAKEMFLKKNKDLNPKSVKCFFAKNASSKKAAKMDKFVEQYLVSALWSSTDDTGEPLDKEHGVSDFAPEALEQAVADCNNFRDKAGDLIAEYDDTDVAHDFWLTRNGHGAGFWDGDYEEEVGKKLTEIAKSFGESSPYIGDDGKIYLYQG